MTPRGVLKRIAQFLNTGNPLNSSTVQKMDENGDFPWFAQRGKIYSDSDKSSFSRYMNLHLALAYDKMSP